MKKLNAWFGSSLVIGMMVIMFVVALGGDNAAHAAIESNSNASIGTMTIDEFVSAGIDKNGNLTFDGSGTPLNLRKRLKDFARIGNVNLEESCDQLTGMVPRFVGGFDVKSGEATDLQRDAMLYNTWLLQWEIRCVSKMPGEEKHTVMMPEGTFYFVLGHVLMDDNSDREELHVIKPYSNVALVGVGNDDDGLQTTLKPYAESSDFEYATGGIDMFFYNNLAAFLWTNGYTGDIYLRNFHFADFTIDGAENTNPGEYVTSGKGFMINLFENGTWDNVTVRNVDATGFGVDCPIGESWIKNSRAIGNGKKVVDPKNGGGSGFGIGTGYSDSESFVISNSYAEGNGKYGFFYEHQDRFTPSLYKATRSDGRFIVTDSTAKGNMWNFGGLRTYETTFSNIKSEVGTYTQSSGNKVSTVRHIFLSDESRDIEITNPILEGKVFSDVDDRAWYADAVRWAESYGIASDPINVSTWNAGTGVFDSEMGLVSNDNLATRKTFGVNENASRADIVAMIWRMMKYPGNTISINNGNVDEILNDGKPSGLVYTPTCFRDVDKNRPFANAIGWAADKGITKGVGGVCQDKNNPTATFLSSSNPIVTRAEAITLLYRLAGSPTPGEVENFSDVKDKSLWYYNAVQWAVANKITNGVGENTFAPNKPCTRSQIVAFLYRYWTQSICEENCPDINRLLDVHHNE